MEEGGRERREGVEEGGSGGGSGGEREWRREGVEEGGREGVERSRGSGEIGDGGSEDEKR